MSNTKQRILDFLSGAMEVKNAAYAEVSKTVYTIVPERMKIHFEGAKKVKIELSMWKERG